MSGRTGKPWPTSPTMSFRFQETSQHEVEVYCLHTIHAFRFRAKRCKCGKVKL